MNASILRILQHALGRDQYGVSRSGDGEDYRSHFVAGPGHSDFETCREAVERGLMVMHPHSDLSGGGAVFFVTNDGKLYVSANSQKPPKLSRGQARYRQFLDADSGIAFGEWLKSRHQVSA